MSLEHSFSDCAYAGMQPGSTGAVSLAFLGVASDAGYSFSDSAYLGLQPGRATARRSAYIGLFDRASVVPPPTPVPPVIGGGKRRNFGVRKPEIPVPIKKRQEIEEELILMYYHNSYFWE